MHFESFFVLGRFLCKEGSSPSENLNVINIQETNARGTIEIALTKLQ